MILDLGVIDYENALKVQRELVSKRKLEEISDSILIVEHPSVITIGRSGSKENLLVDGGYLAQEGIKVLDVDRGGDITFHEPGQLVCYPIIDLKKRKMDLHNYMRDIEDVIIMFLGRFAVKGARVRGATGVWVDGMKIAFIGIAAKNWITYHGFSININNDIKRFSMINPCGMKNISITKLKRNSGPDVPMYEAKKILLDEFKKIFGLKENNFIYEYCTDMA